MYKAAVALFLLILSGTALGQWSADTTLNLQICDLSGEQVLPKIVPTSDGGCFISWFDQRSGDYCVYLQRLDFQGIPQFGENGLLVSDRPQQTWLVDYSLAVDGEDNAIIAFSDVRYSSGDLNVSAYKISSTGEFIWGGNGICLSDTTQSGFDPNPVIAVTGEDNCVFSWGRSAASDFLVFQKLAPDGTKLWGDWGVVMESASSDLSSPVLVPSGSDSVIAMWKNSTGSYPMTVTHLYADMLDVNGSGTWGDSPVLIYDSGAITPWNFPGMICDDAGGAVCFWYDAPSLSSFDVWVQHLNDQGNMLYPMNGARASTNSTDRLHMSPSAAFNPGTGESCVFWVETDGNQNFYGLYGQKFSQAGDREWTDSGLELIPLGNEQISFVNTVLDENGIYVSYLINPSTTSLRVIKLNFDGTVQWGPVTMSAGSLGSKDDPVACTGYDNSIFFAWTDNRNDAGIYAQNVKEDGTTGPYMGIEGPSPSQVAAMSISPNPSSGHVSICVSMNASATVSVDIYDITGRLLETVYSGEMEQGEHTISWTSGSSSNAGVYLVRLRTAERETMRKVVVL